MSEVNDADQVGQQASRHATPPVDRQLVNLNHLLAGLEPRSILTDETHHENELVRGRLGVAASLFAALRARHAPTAEHSLRVALGCSAWSLVTDLTPQQRDELEVAALLHDIGKIGVPDEILRKPTGLTPDQQALMNSSYDLGLQIMKASCVSLQILDTIRYAHAWYDGSNQMDRSHDDLPIASRMVAIMDAFDAMTTPHVYRQTFPRERALAELFDCSGTQFDPQLVHHFATLQLSDRTQLDRHTARRWLQTLDHDDADVLWELRTPQSDHEGVIRCTMPFHEQLFYSLHDGVFFVKADLSIARWNRGMQNMSGVSAEAARNVFWEPDLVLLRDSRGRRVREDNCPVIRAVKTGAEAHCRMLIRGYGSQQIPVDLTAVPITAGDGSRLGATVIFRDASSESNLRERVQTLHKKATQDPLTGLANRAEFDRFHAESLQRHVRKGLPFSLIICDLDRFKRVNDTHGHQAGDAVLIRFAQLLQKSCRSGDLVARYGGEEFVMVCEECDCPQAERLAETIRVELSQTPMAELEGRLITASFGVTELQPGDSVESMLRRADRGLLQAKDSGRNRTVQLGSGMNEQSEPTTGGGNWFTAWLKSPADDEALVQSCLRTNVPINFAVQKLRGFVCDHNGEIKTITDGNVTIRLTAYGDQRRRSDRPVPLLVDLDLRPTRGRPTRWPPFIRSDHCAR